MFNTIYINRLIKNIMRMYEICDIIFKLYLYADNTKMIHYYTDSNHEHELADKVRDTILSFVDDLAEQTFGYFGKPSFGDMSLKQDISIERDLNKICQKCIDIVAPLYSSFNKNEKLSGIISLIDDFKGELGQMAFLGTFDKVSNYKLEK